MPPGWTHDELLDEVLLSYRRTFVPMPDTQVIERPGWLQLITPSLRQGLNEVALSVLGEDEADAVIDATVAQYRELGLRFRWCVGPGSRPADLAERLLRRGLRPVEVRAMYRDTTGAVHREDDDVAISEVETATVDVFTSVMAAGWNLDPVPWAAYYRTILAHAEPICIMLLARYRGQPAGAATLCLLPRSAYLMGAVVLPAFRGRGLYRALVGVRLRYAAGRGILLATTQAQEHTSAPMLERMGFETLCRFPKFSGD